MFAVIKTGGKQYKVAADDVLMVEKLDAEAEGEVVFNDVLMIGEGEAITVGAPTVEGATVLATVVEQTRGPKVINFKKRRRKHSSQRRKGHRQSLTKVRITDILASGTKAAAPAAAAEPVATEAPASTDAATE